MLEIACRSVSEATGSRDGPRVCWPGSVTGSATAIGSLDAMGLALGLLGAIVGPRHVSGHAVPTSSDPAPNATLSEAPHEIVIRFSERVDARASTLEVLDAHGQRVDHGDAAVDPGDPWRSRVGVHGVADGVWSPIWRV
jgi:copper resistance protein C